MAIVGICQPRIDFLSKFMIQNKLVIVMKNSDCAIKKLIKINHENTKVRKHEKKQWYLKLVDNPPYLQSGLCKIQQ